MDIITKYFIRWNNVLCGVSFSTLQSAVEAAENEDFDNPDYQKCTGLLVEPDQFDSIEPMPDEVLKIVENNPVKEYACRHGLFENTVDSSLWIKLAEFVDEYGY
jgi:hypothetical protein